MSSLASRASALGALSRGDSGQDVLALQIALSQAGYRVGQDGEFGPGTESAVMRFQRQHGLKADGEVGPLTASLLDAPHAVLVQTAKPEINTVTGFPHDDTASLMAFYGKPWEDGSLIVRVPVPWTMTFREDSGHLLPVPQVSIHKKAADALAKAFGLIATAAKDDPTVLKRVKNFSGSYNYRPVRGSSRLSCHAFAAALDFDAEDLPLGKTGIVAADMPAAVVDAFDASGATWGNTYHGRKDPMHFQYAHE